MKIKYPLLIFVLLAISLTLTGCWDYIEIESLNFVMGAGFDLTEDENIALTIESMEAEGGEESELVPFIGQSTGRTVFEASRSLTDKIGARTYWAHANVVVVSEEFARAGVSRIISYLDRDPGIRASLWMFVSRDASPSDVLQSDSQLATAVSQHLSNIMNVQRRDPLFIPTSLFDFRAQLSEAHTLGVLPTVQIIEQDDKQIAQVKGGAIFREDRLIDWIDGIESRSLYLIREGELGGPYIIYINMEGEEGYMSFEIMSASSEIKSEVDVEDISFTVSVELFLSLIGLSDMVLQYTDTDIRLALEKQVADQLQSDLIAIINKAQREWGGDPFGFGQLLKREHPDVWRTHGGNWSQVFSTVQVEVEAEASIVDTGVRIKPRRVRE